MKLYYIIVRVKKCHEYFGQCKTKQNKKKITNKNGERPSNVDMIYDIYIYRTVYKEYTYTSLVDKQIIYMYIVTP